jgi:hypothetical protein
MVPGTKVPHFPLLLWGLVFHCLRGFCSFGTVCGCVCICVCVCVRGFAGAQCCFGLLPFSLNYRPSFLRTQPHHCFVVFLVEMVATSTVSELSVHACDPIFIQESGGKYLGEQNNKHDTILGPAVFGI